MLGMTLEQLEALDDSKLRVGEVVAKRRIIRSLSESTRGFAYRDADAIQDRVDGTLSAASRASVQIGTLNVQYVIVEREDTPPELPA